MRDAQTRVTEFHRAFGLRAAARPALLECLPEPADTVARELRRLADRCRQTGESRDGLCARLALALEELAEWAEAHVAGDLVAAADAWGDRAYVLLGDAVAAGLPAEAIFAEVHRSNMTKTAAAGFGAKPTKGDHFEPPRLETILQSATPTTQLETRTTDRFVRKRQE
jgi:predicted HAD superfamily Cof-like phosphohydrolase